MSNIYSQLFYLKLRNDKHSDKREYVSTHVENSEVCGGNSDNRTELKVEETDNVATSDVEETDNVATSDVEVKIKSVFEHFCICF